MLVPQLASSVAAVYDRRPHAFAFWARPLRSEISPGFGSWGLGGKNSFHLGTRNTKSTLDLQLPPLIWGKNGLPTPHLPAGRHSFSPMTTRNFLPLDRNQTESGQKINYAPALDLGCHHLLT
jgi:hypothetical protein